VAFKFFIYETLNKAAQRVSYGQLPHLDQSQTTSIRSVLANILKSQSGKELFLQGRILRRDILPKFDTNYGTQNVLEHYAPN
jgi:hypothetical protein